MLINKQAIALNLEVNAIIGIKQNAMLENT
jgi:hypothetical protein